jgi:hypothetical protein
VRCRLSGICEGRARRDGAAEDDLERVTRASARQRRVREATQWAWKGYR